ncbi:SLC13 family permease [Hydrogenovibrio marinus]|uniref:Sodium:sulfate symporter n=1 Tax=Hydrogenovibrio marinus TaxID=28885 RepID=A0A066ZXD6_HYDMR|nr:SLC13 family permease [Hydrogenovibrio marinus]KDN95021.1 hypothetical protein EI16_01540 [Hydrogenovibrio marinus]BBN59487.1 citrate transporter [Hydrogenovibrio marinus]
MSSITQTQPNYLSFSSLVTLFAAILGITIMFFPVLNLPVEQRHVAGLGIIIISLWATAKLPEHLTAVLFFLVAMLMGLGTPTVVFSGFSSSAFWMIFGGLVIASAVKNTGLSDRIVHSVADKLNGSYARLVLGVIVVGILLGFVMPSATARIALLIPIIIVMSEGFGFHSGSKGRTGLVLAAIFGTFFPTFSVLPNNVPNMVLVGSIETLYNIEPLYGEYLMLHFPVLGVLKALVIWGLIVWQFPDTPKAYVSPHETTPPFTRAQFKMSVILAVTVGLWLTDFIHHISPAWIAVGAAFLLLLPGFGLVNGKQFNDDIKLPPFLIVAGILGLGALLSSSGLSNVIAHQLTQTLPLSSGHDFMNFMSLALMAMTTSVATTAPGVPAVLTPLAEQLAHAAGLPLNTVLMTQVLGFSTPIFIYQVPPLVIGMQLAGEKMIHGAKMVLMLAITSALVLLPLDYLWWKLLGWI